MARGYYFDDFIAGQELVTARRTVTETDIVLFAGLSGDFNPLHTDAEYCKGTGFGHRIAHGLLITAISSGLQNQMGIVEGTTVAILDMRLRFSAPVFPGDTVYCKLTVEDKKELNKPDRGQIVLRADLLNHREELVQQMWTTIWLRKRPSS